MAALDVPAATAAAIAKILNLVGIVISSKHAKKRSTALASPFNGVKRQRVPGWRFRDWRRSHLHFLPKKRSMYHNLQ